VAGLGIGAVPVAGLRIDAARITTVRIPSASSRPARIVAVGIAVSGNAGSIVDADGIAVISVTAFGLTLQGSAKVVLDRRIMAMAIEG
jgi:hypothetical protein